jgi:nitroimidazol reductase NimA-like FMN-containing flavoprotein (pyridoxamine 5'-phosphate oxidase superfamily)
LTVTDGPPEDRTGKKRRDHGSIQVAVGDQRAFPDGHDLTGPVLIDTSDPIGVLMNNPTPQLDGRFSDPDAQATPWTTTRQALEAAQLFWITTVRCDGRPHVTPLVAVWLDGKLHFCTGPGEQKALNLAGNPHVVLTTGGNQWDRGLDVMVEGQARRVTERSDLERLAAAWATKWDGQWRYEVTDTGFAHPDAGGEILVFAVQPTKVLAFTKGDFSQTRYLPTTNAATP